MNKNSRHNRKIEIDGVEILSFAVSHWRDDCRWNGHQIKNTFQPAIVFAHWDNFKTYNKGGAVVLEIEHFEQVTHLSPIFARCKGQ